MRFQISDRDLKSMSEISDRNRGAGWPKKDGRRFEVENLHEGNNSIFIVFFVQYQVKYKNKNSYNSYFLFHSIVAFIIIIYHYSWAIYIILP
jgi:hypothetical protein